MAVTDTEDREVRDIDGAIAGLLLVVAATQTGGLHLAGVCAAVYITAATILWIAHQARWCGSGDIHIAGLGVGVAALAASTPAAEAALGTHQLGQFPVVAMAASLTFAAAVVALAAASVTMRTLTRVRQRHNTHSSDMDTANASRYPLAAALPPAACTLLLFPEVIEAAIAAQTAAATSIW